MRCRESQTTENYESDFEDPSEVICCLETNCIIKVNVLSIVTWVVG